MKKIIKPVLKLFPIIVLWISAHSIYLASLAMNHMSKEGGVELPTASNLLVNFSKINVPYLFATFFTVVLIVSLIKLPKYFNSIQVIMLCIMLLYTTYALMAVSMPFTCLCDAWKQW